MKVKKDKRLNKLMKELWETLNHLPSSFWVENEFQKMHQDLFQFNFLDQKEIVKKILELNEKNIDIFEVDHSLIIGDFESVKKKIQNMIHKCKDVAEENKRKTQDRENFRNLLKKNFSIDSLMMEEDQWLDLLMDEKKMDEIMRALKNKAMW